MSYTETVVRHVVNIIILVFYAHIQKRLSCYFITVPAKIVCKKMNVGKQFCSNVSDCLHDVVLTS